MVIVHEGPRDLKVLRILVGDAFDAFWAELINPGVWVGQKEW